MNLPNKITIFRGILIPIFMIVVLFPFDWGVIEVFQSEIEVRFLVGTIIFTIASLTDYIDGYIARKYDLSTDFGAFMDPLVDKLLVLTALIILVGYQLVPSWVVVIIVGRELAVTGLRVIIAKNGESILAAAWPGKIKTTTQMFAIIFLFLDNFPFEGLGIPMADILLYTSLFFTIYSGFDYFYKAKDLFKGSFK